MDCIFCQIATGKIPGDIVYQDEELLAFRDINPQAPKHLLIIPRKHIPSLAELSPAELPIIGNMVALAHKLAQQEGVAETGYRLVVNYGEWGGQVVKHLHLHLLGGKKLSDKLG
ncbi:MAG: histidine triad nucleotide-binding protein [Dehalococcoidales bacterium]|nr:histidine triad nucleotide-binding protein [Dehalococcoidales bacterium]